MADQILTPSLSTRSTESPIPALPSTDATALHGTGLPGTGHPEPAPRSTVRSKRPSESRGHVDALGPSWSSRIAGTFFALATLAVLMEGWLHRDDGFISPDSGLGYQLGIFGAVTMLLLLLYPLRKRAQFLRRAGATRHWFRAHMIKGIVGPVCILFHANFQSGSLNATVAMACMLMVAGSGIFGRYIYTKIHYGLYGARASLADLREDSDATKQEMSRQFAFAPQLQAQLYAFEVATIPSKRNLLGHILRVMLLGITVRWAHFRLKRFVKRALKLRAKHMGWERAERLHHQKEALRYLRAYIGGVRKAAEFSFYERIFSTWHVLHFPLFLMLILAGIIHVIAVHMY